MVPGDQSMSVLIGPGIVSDYTGVPTQAGGWKGRVPWGPFSSPCILSRGSWARPPRDRVAQLLQGGTETPLCGITFLGGTMVAWAQVSLPWLTYE